MDTHNIYICPIERYGCALKSVRDISRICEEEMRESNHMREITHLYPTLTRDAPVLMRFHFDYASSILLDYRLAMCCGIQHDII